MLSTVISLTWVAIVSAAPGAPAVPPSSAPAPDPAPSSVSAPAPAPSPDPATAAEPEASAAPGASATRPDVLAPVIEKLVVLPFQVARGVDKKQGELLDEVMLDEINQLKPAAVGLIGSADVSALIGLEQQRQMLECDDSSCLAEVGNALGASHMLALSLGSMGSQFLITSKVVDTRHAVVIHRKVLYVGANEDALLAGVRESAAIVADSIGWNTSEASTGDSSEEGDEEGLDALFVSGVALAGVGALAFAGLGTGAMVVDATVVADGGRPVSEREESVSTVLLLSSGSAAGLVALGVGAALLVVSLL